MPASALEIQGRDIENARQEIGENILLQIVAHHCTILPNLLYEHTRIFFPFQNTRRLLVLVLNSGQGSLDYARRLGTIQGMGSAKKDFSVT